MSLFPKNLNEYVASMGIPRGPKSKVFIVDPVNGSDSNPGTNWLNPLKTLLAAEDLCTTNRHDAVLFLSGATADNPTAAIGWDKDYTHLVGLSSNVYGTGQRSRVVALAATALTAPITFAGNGCIVKNMQFNNEIATGTAGGSAIITGDRCFFENVFFMNPTTTTVASYAAKMTGASENVFLRCTFGQTTNARGASTHTLWVTGSSLRNKFVKCEFFSWGTVNSHALVTFATDMTSEGLWTQFEDCLFDNLNGGANLTAGIVDGATDAGHQVIFRGHNDFIGCTAVANPLTYTWAPDAAANVSGLLMIAVVES